ncbi:MAG: hypothetical protein SCK70_15350 [bacterium]|nr:hypothetical protein [bacterium]
MAELYLAQRIPISSHVIEENKISFHLVNPQKSDMFVICVLLFEKFKPKRFEVILSNIS